MRMGVKSLDKQHVPLTTIFNNLAGEPSGLIIPETMTFVSSTTFMRNPFASLLF